MCYSLYLLLFIVDFSLLALLLPVLMFCYALLAQDPAKTFWQVTRAVHASATAAPLQPDKAFECCCLNVSTYARVLSSRLSLRSPPVTAWRHIATITASLQIL